jgi:hypothetical protein
MKELEDSGWPWDEIAAYFEYGSVSVARRALDTFIREYGDKIPVERRREQYAKLDAVEQMIVEDIIDPPFLFDIKGAPVRNPDGSYARDIAQKTRSVEAYLKLSHRKATVTGSDMAVAAKTDVDQVNYQLLVEELVSRVVQSAEPAAIDGVVVSDTLVDDQGQYPAQQPGGDADSPPVTGHGNGGDDHGDGEENDGEDLQEPVDPGNTD